MIEMENRFFSQISEAMLEMERIYAIGRKIECAVNACAIEVIGESEIRKKVIGVVYYYFSGVCNVFFSIEYKCMYSLPDKMYTERIKTKKLFPLIFPGTMIDEEIF